jgi:hypothetical protein
MILNYALFFEDFKKVYKVEVVSEESAIETQKENDYASIPFMRLLKMKVSNMLS